MSFHLPLTFETGTGYDFFASLYVLQDPDRFGLRPSWAAGVRSRLPAAERHFLEDIQNLLPLPAPWVHSLPAPRSASSALWAFSQLAPADRLPALTLTPDLPEELHTMLLRVAERRTWEIDDLDLARSLAPAGASGRPRPWRETLSWWTRTEEFGQAYLAALQSYYNVFFAEEEQRILPALESAVQRARELSLQTPLEELVDTLTGGLHFARLSTARELILTPSYWLTPLAFLGSVAPGRMLLVFGGRPSDSNLVPGDIVPDALLASLKALADPSRLQILRLLSQSPLTLTEIARSLRLRLPTITHHLNALRLAGLVQINLEQGDEKRYAVRRPAVKNAFGSLTDFLQPPFVEPADE